MKNLIPILTILFAVIFPMNLTAQEISTQMVSKTPVENNFKNVRYLGDGFLSTNDSERANLIILTKDNVNVTVERGVTYDSKIVSSKSSFSRALGLSAKAKFGMGGASVKAKLKLAKNFKSSKKKLTIVLNKLVRNKVYTLKNHSLSEEANSFIKKAKLEEYLNRYGNQYVKSVTTGGRLNIIYTLHFTSMEEKTDFESNVNIAYGAGNGAVSFSEKIRKAAANALITMEVISTGIEKAPKLLAVDINSPDNPVNTKKLEELYSFFDDFSEEVKSKDLDNIIDREITEQNFISGAPVELGNLSSLVDNKESIISEAIYLDEEINERIEEVEYFLSDAYKWNTGVRNIETAEKVLKELQVKSRKLLDFVNKVSKATSPLKELPFVEDDLPTLPEDWTIRNFREVGESMTKSLGYGISTSNVKVKIPKMSEGKSFSIDLWVKFHMKNWYDVGFNYSIELVSSTGEVMESIDSGEFNNRDEFYDMNSLREAHPIHKKYKYQPEMDHINFKYSKKQFSATLNVIFKN